MLITCKGSPLESGRIATGVRSSIDVGAGLEVGSNWMFSQVYQTGVGWERSLLSYGGRKGARLCTRVYKGMHEWFALKQQDLPLWVADALHTSSSGEKQWCYLHPYTSDLKGGMVARKQLVFQSKFSGFLLSRLHHPIHSCASWA